MNKAIITNFDLDDALKGGCRCVTRNGRLVYNVWLNSDKTSIVADIAYCSEEKYFELDGKYIKGLEDDLDLFSIEGGKFVNGLLTNG